MNKTDLTFSSVFGSYLKDAESDKPVWIGDVTETMSGLTGCSELFISFSPLYGGKQTIRIAFPAPEAECEYAFLLDYSCGVLYNYLSASGGNDITYIYDASDEISARLAVDIKKAFLPDAPGYGRITRELRRIASLARSASPDGNANRGGNGLAEYLRRTAESALKGVRAGIDVGGTDIKLCASVDGHLAATLEYDWNPSSFKAAEEYVRPVIRLAKELLDKVGAECYDGIGLSFPDVVINNRICGGETPKTLGIRNNPDVDYEEEFLKVSEINSRLLGLCKPGSKISVANDGSVAAFTSAVEIAFSGNDRMIENGAFSHALGTSLGSGWVDNSGIIPPVPLEFYESIIDIGSYSSRKIDAADIRSTRTVSSQLYGADRYLGQASAFRFAYKVNPALLDGFIEERDGIISIISSPADMRKPCLEHIMREAEDGNPDARLVFREIGKCFGQISQEIKRILNPATDLRYVFGRFVKYPHVFEQIDAGFREVISGITLAAAGDSMAYSPLMLELSSRKDITVAQFGQAAGTIYLSAL